MKKILIILILLFNLSVFAQKNLDSKYLTALIYLKTNSEINQKIKDYREHWLKNKKSKNNIESFNISKYISYLSIPNIKEELDIFKIDSKKHREKYYFDIEENILFNELLPNINSKIYLLFSKPIDNYLIAEFMINSSNNEIDMVTHKTGPAMHLLFVFGENNIVKDVYVSYSYYN